MALFASSPSQSWSHFILYINHFGFLPLLTSPTLEKKLARKSKLAWDAEKVATRTLGQLACIKGTGTTVNSFVFTLFFLPQSLRPKSPRHHHTPTLHPNSLRVLGLLSLARRSARVREELVTNPGLFTAGMDEVTPAKSAFAHMPGANYRPLSQGSQSDFRAISPITQPADRPGSGELPAKPPRSPTLPTSSTQHRFAPALHTLLAWPLVAPPLPGPWAGDLSGECRNPEAPTRRSPEVPSSPIPQVHPQSAKHDWSVTHWCWAPACFPAVSRPVT